MYQSGRARLCHSNRQLRILVAPNNTGQFWALTTCLWQNVSAWKRYILILCHGQNSSCGPTKLSGYLTLYPRQRAENIWRTVLKDHHSPLAHCDIARHDLLQSESSGRKGLHEAGVEEAYLSFSYLCFPLNDTGKASCSVCTHFPARALFSLSSPFLSVSFCQCSIGSKPNRAFDCRIWLASLTWGLTLASSPMHDAWDNQSTAATSLEWHLSCLWWDGMLYRAGRGRRDGLHESSLVFPLHSHWSHKAIKRVSN